jgi:hypothetical protein
MWKRHDSEPRESVTTSGLSYTEAFVKKITSLLQQGLTADNYEQTLKAIMEQCTDDYDLNRAGAAAAKLAEREKRGTEQFRLYNKMAGDLFRMQCGSERTSGRTTIFTGFYNSAMDAYLDGGYDVEAVGVAFEHSHWLITNALYRDEAGKRKYLDLSVKAFDEVIRRATGALAAFLYGQQEARKKAAEALQDAQPPARLTNVKDPVPLRADAQTYREMISFLEERCKAYDVAAYFAKELAAVVENTLPELAREYTALARDLLNRHVALLHDHGIS